MGQCPVWFNFELEYQKGCDNTVADALSQVTTQLDPDTVKSILARVALGLVHWADVHDPAIVEGDFHLEQEVHVTAGHTLVQMHVMDWVAARKRTHIECSVRLAEKDRFEDTSGRTHL